jgi:hypothetical protein
MMRITTAKPHPVPSPKERGKEMKDEDKNKEIQPEGIPPPSPLTQVGVRL